MAATDDFDAFYKDARQRVLLQTYALTSDLVASRSAARDAFVAAWHHWRKVGRHPHPEEWVRHHAWQVATRRHTARLGRRDRSLDPEVAATLDALGELTGHQRRALVLAELSDTAAERAARELGLTDAAYDRTLKLARATYPIHRGVDAGDAAATLHGLGSRLEDTRLPRASIIRRAGATRRRTHTGLGLAGAAAALVVATVVVGLPGQVAPTLANTDGSPTGAPASIEPLPPIDPALLLSRQQVGTTLGATVAEPETDDNTAGTGLHTVCQQAPFADPDGVAALVRRMSVTSPRPREVRQAVDLSRSTGDAERAYTTAVGWYGDCTEERVQLLQAYGVEGVGDQASLFVLRRWRAPVTTYAVGVARTGDLVTQVVHQVEDAAGAPVPAATELLRTALASLCTHDDGGACTGTATAVPAPPPAAAERPGFLHASDLPPVGAVDQPWVVVDAESGTPPVQTLCDSDLKTAAGATYTRTRSGVIVDAGLPASFGLGQTVRRFQTWTAAAAWQKSVADRMAGCEDKHLTATVQQVVARRTPDGAQEVLAWHLELEVAEDRVVDYWLTAARNGADVSQVLVVTAPNAQMPNGAFPALAERSLQRLTSLEVR